MYNRNGLEILDEDVQFIKDRDIFYVALDGEEFNNCAILDEYEIGKIIGEGGFGKVYLAIHKDTKKKVAVKFMDISEQRKQNFKHCRVQQSNNDLHLFFSLERKFSVSDFQRSAKLEEVTAQKHHRALSRVHRREATDNDNGTCSGRRGPRIRYEERKTVGAKRKENSTTGREQHDLLPHAWCSPQRP